MVLDAYNNEIYTKPFWQGNTVYHEPLIFITENGEETGAKLLFCPEEIITVRSSDLKTEYIKGKDYILSGNEIILPEGSRIPTVNMQELYCEEKSFPSRDKERYYAYLGGSKLLTKQVAVTYRYKDNWQGYIPQFAGELLPCITEKIAKKEKVNITFVGDSITAMGDISGSVGIEPLMPKYPDMLTQKLKNICGCEIEMQNFAIGGTLSKDFFENKSVSDSAVASNPDLLIIAYGMNDGSGWGVKPTDFANNIKKIADYVCEKNPHCEVIAVSTVVPNRDACWGDGNPIYGYQDKYENELLKLEKQGFAVARMTSVYKYLEEKKGFYSLTGNGINHPNDFVVRAYAQILFAMLIEK